MTSIDQYIAAELIDPDPILAAAVRASEEAGLPPIAVSPAQGKLLHLLARLQGTRRILELGTLGGYSTIWLARALPADGKLVTLEASPRHAEVARANIDRAELAAKVEVIVGPAQETLPRLAAEGAGPFDLIFIDADKQSYPEYLERTLEMSRIGTLIIGDNVVRAGAILDPDGDDPKHPGEGIIQGVRRFYELLAEEPRVDATVIQTVGVKGHDGFALALVTS